MSNKSMQRCSMSLAIRKMQIKITRYCSTLTRTAKVKNSDNIKFMLLSRFSRVQLCATPQTAAHQASPPLGFSRQEHWSGLPFPSPMNESEKWKWSRSVVSNSSRPRGLQPTRLLRPWDFPGKSTGVGCHCLLQIYKDVEKLDHSYIAAGNVKWYSHSGKQFVSFLKS